MKLASVLLFLVCAACLETVGDAIVRQGLHGATGGKRMLLLIAGGLVLFAYGCFVNAPKWDFGRLLGIYVCFFFVIAQIIDWIGFHHKPTLPIYLGGSLIIIGGLIISLWKGG